MAEKKSVGHAYNVDFLNVVFAASSLFLFLSVIWMVWDDYDRDWKSTQRRFAQLEYQVTQAQLQQATRAVDRGKIQQLQAQQQESAKKVAANQQKVDELQRKVKDLDNQLYRATTDYQTAKATYDQDRYDYEASRNAKASNAEAKGKNVAEEERRVNELNLEMERLTAERTAVQKDLAQYTGEVAAVAKQITDLTAEEARLQKRLDVIAPSAVKDYFLNAPLLDFMAPTLKIQQVILPNVVDDVNFIRVPKMDRCRTCHLAIDRKGYEKYPQPFTTHPNLNVYLGSDSKHPLDQIGCTVCHEGMGQSVSFRDASHTPSGKDEKERETTKVKWEKEYDWEEPRHAAFLERLGSFARLIRLDKRGTGLSDRHGGIPDLETRMDDVRAVMDAAGAESAVVFGYFEGGPMSVLFAATYPERTRALVLFSTYAKVWNPELTQEEREAELEERVLAHWGDGSTVAIFAPDADDVLRSWWGARERLAGSPGAARNLITASWITDVTDVLPAVQAPTLVLYRGADPILAPEQAQFLAEQIPEASLVEVPGNSTFPWLDYCAAFSEA